MCELYGRIRQRWPQLSVTDFRLSNGTNDIPPDNGRCTQINDLDLNLQDGSCIMVLFLMLGGIVQLLT